MKNFDYHFKISAGKKIPGMMDIINKISKQEMPSDEAFLAQLKNLSFQKPSNLKEGMENVNVIGKVFDIRQGEVNIHGVSLDGIKVFIGKPESPMFVEFSEQYEDVIKEGSELKLAFGNVKMTKFEGKDVLLFDEGPFTLACIRHEDKAVLLRDQDFFTRLKKRKLKEIKDEKDCMIAELHCPQSGESSLSLAEKVEKEKACKISLFGFGGGCSLELTWEFEQKINIRKCIEVRRRFKFTNEIGELFWGKTKLTNYFTIDVEDIRPIDIKYVNVKSRNDICKTKEKYKILQNISLSSGIKSKSISQRLRKGTKTELYFKTPFPQLLPFGEGYLSGNIEVLKSIELEYNMKKPGRYQMFKHPNCLGFCWKYKST